MATRLPVLWFAIFATAVLAACGDEKGTTTTTNGGEGGGSATVDAPTVATIGKPIRDFVLKDTRGAPFDFAKRAYARDDAQAAVEAAAQAHQDDFEEIVLATGRPFGLMPSDEVLESLTEKKSKEAIVDWVMAAKDQPILLTIWSPKCPTCKKYNDRLHDLVGSTGVRMYAINGNFNDKVEHIEKFRDAYGFAGRVLRDDGLVVTDMLGGERTPHFMLVDTDGVLRYRGGMDNDPQEFKEDDEREDWLKDAIVALQAGKDIAKAQTPPSG